MTAILKGKKERIWERQIKWTGFVVAKSHLARLQRRWVTQSWMWAFVCSKCVLTVITFMSFQSKKRQLSSEDTTFDTWIPEGEACLQSWQATASADCGHKLKFANRDIKSKQDRCKPHRTSALKETTNIESTWAFGSQRFCIPSFTKRVFTAGLQWHNAPF